MLGHTSDNWFCSKKCAGSYNGKRLAQIRGVRKEWPRKYNYNEIYAAWKASWGLSIREFSRQRHISYSSAYHIISVQKKIGELSCK